MWAENPQATPSEQAIPQCSGCAAKAGVNSWGNAIAVWGFHVCHACAGKWDAECDRLGLFESDAVKQVAVRLFANTSQIAGRGPNSNERSEVVPRDGSERTPVKTQIRQPGGVHESGR